jgi:hydrogenase maturation protein HypF
LKSGFKRVAHLRRAELPGGDAAAQFPVQAAAGFLAQLEDLPDLMSAPFNFDSRYKVAQQLARKRVRSFRTTSMGRLFDTAAALLGFTRGVTFEGQAAIWLEQSARSGNTEEAYPLSFNSDELDFRPLLKAVIRDRIKGLPVQTIARAFQRGIAEGLSTALTTLSRKMELDTVVLSGGVFQNELLLEDLKALLSSQPLTIWTNHAVPPNDGGISLGQAALAAFVNQSKDGQPHA